MVIENEDIGVKSFECVLYSRADGIFFCQLGNLDTCLLTPLKNFIGEGKGIFCSRVEFRATD